MEILGIILGPIIDFVKWVAGKFKKPDPVLVLKRREELKKEFEQHHPSKSVIIRDIKRMDSYPEISTKKGISPWFRVEFKGLYHRGIEVFLPISVDVRKDDNGKWIITDKEYGDKFQAISVGRIPFDSIEHTNWEGDEFYREPHVYCRFNTFKKQPYESIPLFVHYPQSDHYYEIEGLQPWKNKKGFWFLKK